MMLLPPANTPLNQHSLVALEDWLTELGAKQSFDDPCSWQWLTLEWYADIKIAKDELQVTWEKNGIKTKCLFSYGLSREDVYAAIIQGP